MQLFFSRGLLISPKRTNALMKGIMRIIGMLPKLTVISKLFGRSEVTREERSAIKWHFVPRALRSPRACLRSPEKRSQQKTLVRLVIFRMKYHESEKNANWFLFCSMLSLLLYFPPHFWLVLMSLAKTSFVMAQIRVPIKHFLTSIRPLVHNLLIKGILLFWQQWHNWQRYGELHLSFLQRK